MSRPLYKDARVRQLQDGDDEVFKAIYREYHLAVFANLSRLVHRAPIAEDLLQEVFLQLWESRHKLGPEHTIAGWLFTTSFYKASAHLRKAVKESLVPLSDEVADEVWDPGRELRLDAIETAIDLLPPRKKMAFRLCRLEGKSYEEAAAELGLTTASVKDYVKTASRFVRDHVVTQYPALIGVALIELYLHT